MTLKEKILINRFKKYILRNQDYFDNETGFYVLDTSDGYVLMHVKTHEIRRNFYKRVLFSTLSQMNQETKVLNRISIYFDGSELCKPYDEVKQVLKDIKNKCDD